MQTYTVHEPRPAPDNIEQRAASLIFVKEGFATWAFAVPLIWLLANRLWLASAAYVGTIAAISALAKAAGIDPQAVGWVFIAINLIIAFEARDLLRADLEARGYVLRAVVSGRSLAECEHRYLREWLPDARLDQARLNAELTGSGGTDKRNYKEPVIGMFPAHGG